MKSANTKSNLLRLVAPLMGCASIGFSGPAAAVPPPPPPPATAATTVGTPPPPPPVAAVPTSIPAPPPDQVAPPPPPPAPERTAAPQQWMPPQTQPRWGGPTPPTSWQPMDPSISPMWPARIEFEEGDVIPPGYEIKSRPDRTLLTGGLITLLVPYTISFLFGSVFALDGGDREQREFGPLLIPVLGPFISMGMWDSTSEEGAFIMLANGFAQTAGAAMIVTSVLLPDKYIERMSAMPGKPQLFVGPGHASLRLRF